MQAFLECIAASVLPNK